MRKIQVPLKRYAHPEYLRDLCNRIERCYFSADRDWRCIEAIFNADIKAMEAREPKPETAEPKRALPHSRKSLRTPEGRMLARERGTVKGAP